MRNLIKNILLFLLLSIFTQGCVLLLPFIDLDKSKEMSSGLANSCPYKTDKATRQAVPVATAVAPVDRVSKLIDDLRTGNEVARTHAATDLGFSGEQSSRVLEALGQATQSDQSKWVRRAAVKSLEKAGGAKAIPLLRQAAKDRNKWVAHSAKNALGRLQWRRARLR